MDAQREKIFRIPARPDGDESEVKTRAVEAAVKEWGGKTENLRVECLQWHGPADRISPVQSAENFYDVTVTILNSN